MRSKWPTLYHLSGNQKRARKPTWPKIFERRFRTFGFGNPTLKITQLLQLSFRLDPKNLILRRGNMDRTLHPPQPTASFRDEEPVAFDLVGKTAISGPRFFQKIGPWPATQQPGRGKCFQIPASKTLLVPGWRAVGVGDLCFLVSLFGWRWVAGWRSSHRQGSSNYTYFIMGGSNLMQIDGNSIWTSRPRISRRFRSKPWKIATGMLGASDVAVKTHSEVVSRHQWGHQRAGSSWIPGRIPWGTCWRAWVWNILWARQHESIICLITIVGPPRWCFSASSRGSLSRPWSCWKQQASWRELRCLAVRESPRFGHFWRDDSWHQFPCSASFELLVILKTPELHFFAANSLRIHESISPIKMDGILGLYFVEKKSWR